MAKGLAVTGDLAAAAEQIKGLYKLFDSCDCTMVEVCSLIEGGVSTGGYQGTGCMVLISGQPGTCGLKGASPAC